MKKQRGKWYGARWLAVVLAWAAQASCLDRPEAEHSPLVRREDPGAGQTLTVTFRNLCENEVHIVVGPQKGPVPEPPPGLEQIQVPARSERVLTAEPDWRVWHLGDNGGWAAVHLVNRPKIVQIPKSCVGIEPVLD